MWSNEVPCATCDLYYDWMTKKSDATCIDYIECLLRKHSINMFVLNIFYIFYCIVDTTMYNERVNTNNDQSTHLVECSTRYDHATLNVHKGYIMSNDANASNVANDANTNDALIVHTGAPATNDQRTMSTHVHAKTTNEQRVERLLKKLNNASRNEQKRIRRALRALNHFGGKRERSSRYVTIDEKQRVKINRDAIRERAKRIASQNERDANVDE